MSTVYIEGSDGPWLADDTETRADGHYHNAVFTRGHPTVDGLERHSPPRSSQGQIGGLVHAGEVGLTRRHNTDRGRT